MPQTRPRTSGGATGSIGDPSGKSQERQLLTKEILDHNIASVKVQLAKLLDFETKQNPARLVNNADWTAGVTYSPTSGDYARWLKDNGGPYDGFLLSTANCFPALLLEVINAIEKGDIPSAGKISRRPRWFKATSNW